MGNKVVSEQYNILRNDSRELTIKCYFPDDFVQEQVYQMEENSKKDQPKDDETFRSESTYFFTGLVILSHTIGGTCEGLQYLGEYFSTKLGWLVIVPEHQESNETLFRQYFYEEEKGLNLKKRLRDAMSHFDINVCQRGRSLDLDTIFSWLDQRRKGWSFAQTAFLGHGMGSATVMIECGALNSCNISGKDRFDYYIALSPDG